MEYGWICPRCSVVNAPHMDMCKNCLPTKEEQEGFIKQATEAKTYNWCRAESENVISWREGIFVNFCCEDFYFEWDAVRIVCGNLKNKAVINDIAWEQIAAWWIAPAIHDTIETITIVIKGKSGFLYSFDLKNTVDTILFIDSVFRHHVKEKELSL